MKAGIHPETHDCTVTCTCGNSFTIISNVETMQVGLCSACHPFYTGQQKFVDSAGRVDRFAQRYKIDNSQLKDLAKKKEGKRKKGKLEHKINPKAKKVAAEAPKDKKAAGGEEAKAEESKS